MTESYFTHPRCTIRRRSVLSCGDALASKVVEDVIERNDVGDDGEDFKVHEEEDAGLRTTVSPRSSMLSASVEEASERDECSI